MVLEAFFRRRRELEPLENSSSCMSMGVPIPHPVLCVEEKPVVKMRIDESEYYGNSELELITRPRVNKDNQSVHYYINTCIHAYNTYHLDTWKVKYKTT